MSTTPNDPSAPHDAADLEAVARLRDAYHRIRTELAKVIVGQETALEELLVALFCRGHCILEGVPGLAKTLMISTLARTLSLTFSRVQFTPDLMPADITGTEVIEVDRASGHRELRFVRGPIFANVILADEINRTPPKTQAALLEAMQEHQVTAAGTTHRLPNPFFVLATQNPIEQEGTYPLPEAQLDRFMFKILVDYPSEEEEFRIIKLTTELDEPQVDAHLDADDILRVQHTARRVPCADHVVRFAMRLARLSRPRSDDAPDFVRDYVAWGAGPRASQHLVLAGKALALLRDRNHVAKDDIRSVAGPVLRHRILTNFNAEAEGVTADALIAQLIEHIPDEETNDLRAAGVESVFKDVDPSTV